MNLRFVEAFYWVVELKSVTLAAAKLCISQSAMSSRVSALEEELGTCLIDRCAKEFRLTASGLRFFSYAEKLLEVQSQLKAELRLGGLLETTLRIGVIEAVLHSWLIPLVEQLRSGHAGLEFELTVEASPILLEQLRRGSLDLVFAALPDSASGQRSRSLPPMDMIFTGAASTHERRTYTLEDLATLDILTFQRGSQPHSALVDLFRQAGLAPRRVHPISSISAMVQLVEGGFGVATLPRVAAARFIAMGAIRELPCLTSIPPLPIFATHRFDPTNTLLQSVAKEAITFVTTQAAFETGAKRKQKHSRSRFPCASEKVV